MFIDKSDLATRMADRVSAACVEHGIEEGAIIISVTAAEGFADDPWFAGPKGFIFSVNPKACDTGFGNAADGKNDRGMGRRTMMKVEGAKRAMGLYDEQGLDNPTPEQCTSGALPDSSVITGTCNWPGAVAIQIGRLSGPMCSCHGGCPYRGELFATIYVSVAGGPDGFDEKAAWAALSVIREEVDKVDSLMLASNLVNFSCE